MITFDKYNSRYNVTLADNLSNGFTLEDLSWDETDDLFEFAMHFNLSFICETIGRDAKAVNEKDF